MPKSKVGISGRVRDKGAKALLAKQLQGLGMENPSFMNLQTGQIKSKKAKKEKIPAEEAQAELKKLSKLWFDLTRSKAFVF